MDRLTGRVTIVQEQRFRLKSSTGQSYLFVLSCNANVGPCDLRRFQVDGTEVLVDYSGQPGLASATARRVHATSSAALR